mmetsp:Transcript_24660/g.38344  ORF Transcript_24660/g.38344 Transcript_24660/m.38344 type:complete len:222 (-) Transcript_24660:740-1405(-)
MHRIVSLPQLLVLEPLGLLELHEVSLASFFHLLLIVADLPLEVVVALLHSRHTLEDVALVLGASRVLVLFDLSVSLVERLIEVLRHSLLLGSYSIPLHFLCTLILCCSKLLVLLYNSDLLIKVSLLLLELLDRVMLVTGLVADVLSLHFDLRLGLQQEFLELLGLLLPLLGEVDFGCLLSFFHLLRKVEAFSFIGIVKQHQLLRLLAFGEELPPLLGDHVL